MTIEQAGISPAARAASGTPPLDLARCSPDWLTCSDLLTNPALVWSWAGDLLRSLPVDFSGIQ